MPSLRLWYSPGACSLAPHILLEESGLPYETTRVNVFRGAPEELKLVNPKGQVPVLELDGKIITEVSAILTTISQLVPDKHFLGHSNLDISRSYEWFSYLGVNVHKQAFGAIFRPGRYSDDATAHDSIRQRGIKNAIECFEAIEKQIVSDHLVGNDFTASEAYLFVFYRWAALFLKQADMAERYPKCTALVRNLIDRPAVKAALEAEEIEALSQKV